MDESNKIIGVMGEPATDQTQTEEDEATGHQRAALDKPSRKITVRPAEFGPLPEPDEPLGGQSIDLILDVPLRITVELGRATMSIKDVLALGPGSVIELDKLAGEAVDIMANERLIARGEVVVVDENFGVRVTDIVNSAHRSTAID